MMMDLNMVEIGTEAETSMKEQKMEEKHSVQYAEKKINLNKTLKI